MFLIPLKTDDYICKDEHIKDKGIDEDGRVCHCFQDLCNKEVPQPDPTAPTDHPTNPTDSPSPSTTCQTSCTTTCSSNAGLLP